MSAGPMGSPERGVADGPAMERFREATVRAVGLGLGSVCVPMALVDVAQGVDSSDAWLFLAATGYALGGAGLLLAGATSRRPSARPLFLASSATVSMSALLFETPTGAARLEGLASFFLLQLVLLMGHRSWRTAAIAATSALYPAVVFLRELYRPDPMLADPFELYPQGVVGAVVVASLGVLMLKLVEALEAQVAAARAADAAKDRFLQNMSHELRTPLNAVVGYAELLAEDGLADPQVAERDLERIREAAGSLLDTIDDILELARLDGREPPRLEEVPLEPLLAEIASSVGPTLRRKGVALTLPPAPGSVRGERRALRRILTNLVGNAAKFTERGEIRVEVVRGSAHDEVHVVDTGPGFPSELGARLFEPFVQADDSTTRRHGGSGLGLAISARLADALGGRIQAESVPGEGATFRLVLPRAADRYGGPPSTR